MSSVDFAKLSQHFNLHRNMKKNLKEMFSTPYSVGHVSSGLHTCPKKHIKFLPSTIYVYGIGTKNSDDHHHNCFRKRHYRNENYNSIT